MQFSHRMIKGSVVGERSGRGEQLRILPRALVLTGVSTEKAQDLTAGSFLEMNLSYLQCQC